MPALCARDASFHIGGKQIIAPCSVELARGHCCALIGPSGAGKSTLLKMLCGVRTPSHGRVLLDGVDVAKASRDPSRLGYVPQDDIVHGDLSVAAVLRYAAELRLDPMDAQQRAKRIDEVIGLLGLGEQRPLRVQRLSGGQRKRVSIAVELLAKPNALFLDEPTSGLDPRLETQMMHMLNSLAHAGRCVVLSTHVLDSLEDVDVLGVVYAGYLVFWGPLHAAASFFGVEHLRQIYNVLGQKSAVSWAQSFASARAQLALPPPRLPAEQTPPSDTATSQHSGHSPGVASAEQALLELKQRLNGKSS